MPSKWEDNSIQFPRLIAEAEAAGLWGDSVSHVELIAESMDLEVKEVFEIIERAQTVWDKIVADIPLIRGVFSPEPHPQRGAAHPL